MGGRLNGGAMAPIDSLFRLLHLVPNRSLPFCLKWVFVYYAYLNVSFFKKVFYI